MGWYYSDQGRQIGPVEDAALDDLARRGVIRNETPVWREGMANWQPYGAVRAPQPLPPPPGAPYGPPPGGFVQPPAAAVAPGEPATWANRVLGYLIDSLFVMVVMAVFYFVVFTVFGSALGLGGALNSDGLQGLGTFGCCCLLALFPAATIAVGLYNRVHLVSQRGSSIGQGVMKIKIVNAQGGLLSFQTALIRLLAQAALSFIPFLGMVDLLWPLWDPQRQTLHDKAVGSFAINNPQG
jgi:uncharacterized RDD family membrane protein YckC